MDWRKRHRHQDTDKGVTLSTNDTVTIAAPNFQTAAFTIEGSAPYVAHKFSQKARLTMMQKQAAGSTARGKKVREARDFEADYQSAMHVSADGWTGIPAPAFRNAMISACRAAGFVMTRAKLSVFVEPDGFDADDGTPLVRITKGEPEVHEGYARNETGVVDIRVRPMWREGWQAVVRVTFDADMLTVTDIANLLARAGLQVGVGEGRPDSKKSAGMGWGTFRIAEGTP